VTYQLPPYAVKFRNTAQTTKRLFEAERPVAQFPTVAELHVTASIRAPVATKPRMQVIRVTDFPRKKIKGPVSEADPSF
jgi:hypothetical protein